MKHLYSGKVRDIYEIDDEHLLFVTSDRISAFDVVMAEPIPGKGRVLTALTAFWAGQLADVAPTHLVRLGVPPGADLAGSGVDPAFRGGPFDGGAPSGDAADRVHRARVPVGVGVGRVPTLRHYARSGVARRHVPVGKAA